MSYIEIKSNKNNTLMKKVNKKKKLKRKRNLVLSLKMKRCQGKSEQRGIFGYFYC